MTDGPNHMDDEIAHSHRRMAEMTIEIESLRDAARAMLAALIAGQKIVERSAVIYADRLASDGTSHASEKWFKALKQIRAAIAQAEEAGIK